MNVNIESAAASAEPDAAQALIALGRYAEAAEKLETELRDTTDVYTTFSAYVGVMLLSNQFDKLVDSILSKEKQLLERQDTTVLCAAILRVHSTSDLADKFEAAFVDNGGRKEELLGISAYVARMSARPDLQLDFLSEKATIQSDTPNRALLQYMQICFQYLEADRAEQIRTRVDATDPYGQFLLANLDAVKGDTSAVLDRVDGWLSDADSVPYFASAIENLWCSVGIPELTESMNKAVRKWHADPNVLGRGIFYHFIDPRERDPDGRPLLERFQVTAGNHLSVIEAEIDNGAYSNAMGLLQRTERFTTEENRRRRSDLGALCRKLSALPAGRRIIADKPGSDWLLSDPAEPGKLCIVFTGLNGRPTLGLQTLDRYLASLGYQVLYLRDFNRLSFANGVVSQGPTQTETLAALAKLIQETGAVKPVFLGASLGAIGAVEIGLKLKIERILAFGYHDRAKSGERWRLGDSRASIVGIREHISTGGQVRSLEDHLKAAEPGTQIDVFYNPANAADAYYARSFAGLPGIRLHPIEAGRSHDCLRVALLEGVLDSHL